MERRLRERYERLVIEQAVHTQTRRSGSLVRNGVGSSIRRTRRARVRGFADAEHRPSTLHFLLLDPRCPRDAIYIEKLIPKHTHTHTNAQTRATPSSQTQGGAGHGEGGKKRKMGIRSASARGERLATNARDGLDEGRTAIGEKTHACAHTHTHNEQRTVVGARR